MRPVRWTFEAGRRLDDWIDYLKAQAGARVAKRAYVEVTALARSLGDSPERYRASELWDGMRELPLSNWNKLAIYRVEPDEIVVIAFYDQRQDLAAVDPFSE